jgi:tRNA dimethylallyltransferase
MDREEDSMAKGDAPLSLLLRIEPGSPVIAVIGPTAVGKTQFSIELALEVDAEIISADSRQIYHETTIGTAKPTPEELAAVPHHFVNERSISESFTAAEFAREAAKRIDDIRSRGRRVLVVGGSTLYIHALLFGLDDIPPTDPDVRKTLNARLDSDGLAALQAELEVVDPKTASGIDVSNPRRVLRALEVFHSTGKPFSHFRNVRPPTSGLRRPMSDVLILTRPREVLYDRINARVDEMYKNGLVEEVDAILKAGHSPSLQALQTIGYRETIGFLEGEFDHARMVELVKRNTRRYAKRQLTWFRRYPEAEWIDLNSMQQ